MWAGELCLQKAHVGAPGPTREAEYWVEREINVKQKLEAGEKKIPEADEAKV